MDQLEIFSFLIIGCTVVGTEIEFCLIMINLSYDLNVKEILGIPEGEVPREESPEGILRLILSSRQTNQYQYLI